MYDDYQNLNQIRPQDQEQAQSHGQTQEQNQSQPQERSWNQPQFQSQPQEQSRNQPQFQSQPQEQSRNQPQFQSQPQEQNRTQSQEQSQTQFQGQAQPQMQDQSQLRMSQSYPSGQSSSGSGQEGHERQGGGVYSGVNGMNGGMQENGTYRYSSRYPNHFTPQQAEGAGYQAGSAGGKHKKEKAEKKPLTGFKKVLLSAGMGISFGLCAGLSFLAVETLTGLGTEKTQTADLTELTEPIEKSEDTTAAKAGVTGDSSKDTEATALSGGVTSTIVSDVSNVVKEAMPSVVSIVNTFTERYSYFGQNFSQESNASGSGIIVGQNDTELLIVTNYHVVEGSDTLMVSFVDSSAAEAQVKGTNPSRDLAVIAVPLSNLSEETKGSISVAKLGDSDSLTVGEPAIAIGNALGYGQSVTTGVVSALDREIADSDTGSATFIQTDAAINPGNSGGALLNAKGEVIGINSNKIGGTAVEGMGYAIPISAAKPIIEELMSRETRTKVDAENVGYLGISGVSVTTDASNVYGMPEGVFVAKVYEGTGAHAAGVTQGSIITKLNGIEITTMEDLSETLQYYEKGDSVELTIMQPGIEGYEEKTVTVVLGPKAK